MVYKIPLHSRFAVGLAFQRWLRPAVAALLERSDAGHASAMKAPQ